MADRSADGVICAVSLAQIRSHTAFHTSQCITCYLPIATYHPLPTTYYYLLPTLLLNTTYYLLLRTAGCLLLAADYSLLTAHCSLLTLALLPATHYYLLLATTAPLLTTTHYSVTGRTLTYPPLQTTLHRVDPSHAARRHHRLHPSGWNLSAGGTPELGEGTASGLVGGGGTAGAHL